MPGLSAIDMTFEEGTDLYLARQMVAERMSQAAALPNVGTPPVMVQPTASTSRVAMVAMRSADVSMVEMSVLARWQMRPRLMAIPGVSQVSIWGQRERQLQVQVDPARLQSNQVTLTQLIESTGNALWVSPLSFVEASTPGTGGFVETPNQRIGVQHVSPITTSDELADIAIEGVAGAPRRLGDVADVIEDHQPLIGDATRNGERSLMLVIERFPDADVAQVTEDVEEALGAMSAGLTGITVDTDVYRPAGYLESATSRLGIAAMVGAGADAPRRRAAHLVVADGRDHVRLGRYVDRRRPVRAAPGRDPADHDDPAGAGHGGGPGRGRRDRRRGRRPHPRQGTARGRTARPGRTDRCRGDRASQSAGLRDGHRDPRARSAAVPDGAGRCLRPARAAGVRPGGAGVLPRRA